MSQKTDELRGTAFDAKAGAVVLTADERTIYVECLDYWPDDVVGKKVLVKGILKKKKLIPDPVVSPDGAISQGASEEQLVLEKPKWELVE